MGTNAAADALNPIGDSYAYSNGEALRYFHPSFKRAAPFSEVLPEPLASYSPMAYTATAFSQHQGPSGSNLSALDEDGSATRAAKKGRGMTVQPSPRPRFKASSPSVVPRSIQEIPSSSRRSLSPWTYKLTPENADGVARDGIFTPFDEDDGDDEIVWDPRPRYLCLFHQGILDIEC